MDRVGGYLAYQALLEDSLAFDDVVIALEGEADAQRLADMEARSKAKRGNRDG